jgi:hypothetical protein
MLSKRLLVLIILGCYGVGLVHANSTHGTMKKARQEGEQLAQSLHQQVLIQLPHFKPEDVPSFVTANPEEIELLNTEGNFDQALHSSYQRNKEAQLLKETADTRQHVSFEAESPSFATQHNTTASEDCETLSNFEGFNEFKHLHEANCQQNTPSNQKELLEGLSTLHLLKEVQDSIRHSTDTQQSIEIGKGTLHSIDNFIMKLFNSISKQQGAQQQEYSMLEGNESINNALAALHANKKCYYIGRNILREVLAIPIHERYQFCCFESEFMRILHEKGRPFVGLGWGTAEDPICRGFTLEELNKIPLDKLDFAPIFESLLKNQLFGDMEALQDKTKAHITQHLQQLKSKLQQNHPPAPQEVSHAL